MIDFDINIHFLFAELYGRGNGNTKLNRNILRGIYKIFSSGNNPSNMIVYAHDESRGIHQHISIQGLINFLEKEIIAIEFEKSD